MKASKGTLTRSLDQPDPAIRLYLFHGPDEAGSRSLASRLLAGLGAEKSPIAAAQLKSDPALLSDEAGAISMFGARQAIWIDPAGDEIVAACQALLDADAIENPAVVIAGALRKTSGLLKLAEASALALTHASYPLEGRDLEQLAITLGRAQGLRIDSGVARRIVTSAGGNQAIIAAEIEKYAVFLCADPDTPRDLDSSALDLLGLDTEGDAAQLGDLALDGELRLLCDTLDRVSGGAEPIPLLRTLHRRILQLVPLRARMDAGESLDAVMTSAGKSLFWRDKAIYQRLLARWTSARIAQLSWRLGRLERQVMLTPVPDESALGEELIATARAARR